MKIVNSIVLIVLLALGASLFALATTALAASETPHGDLKYCERMLRGVHTSSGDLWVADCVHGRMITRYCEGQWKAYPWQGESHETFMARCEKDPK